MSVFYGEHSEYYFITLTRLFLQEAKMLIARAYRHTEKLLLDNRDKLSLVSCSFLSFIYSVPFILRSKTV